MIKISKGKDMKLFRFKLVLHAFIQHNNGSIADIVNC